MNAYDGRKNKLDRFKHNLPISDFLFADCETASRKFSDRDYASNPGLGEACTTCSIGIQSAADDVTCGERFADSNAGTVGCHEIAQKWKCQSGNKVF